LTKKLLPLKNQQKLKVKFDLANLEQLSLEQMVGQMTIVRTSGYLLDRQLQYPAWESKAADLQRLVKDCCIGGVIFLGGSHGEMSLRTAQIQSWAKYPLLMAADIEEGVGQRFAGATWFPPPMALSAIHRQDIAQSQEYARQMGAITAREALAIGLNWILAPIVDVNNNPANPVINVRAFGEDPSVVSDLANAFMAGAADYPVLTCAKHFPGHGDTATDSHIQLPVIKHDLDRLKSLELKTFQSSIDKGVDSVMTAHLQIPALDPEYPATLSRKILTDYLRGQMGYDGLIVTDALMMGAIVQNYGAEEAAVMAVAAGADLLMMPVDAVKAIEAVCAAVRSGRIAESQIRASVARIWQAKQKIFQQAATTEVLTLANTAAAGNQLASSIDRSALQSRGSLPLTPTGGRNLIVIDEILDCAFLGRTAPAIIQLRDRQYDCQIINKYTPPDFSLVDKPTILQLFIRGNPFGGGLGIVNLAKTLCQQLLEAHQLQALVIYGSPYLFEEFAAQLPPEIPAVFCYGQMVSSQSIALECLFATSKTMGLDKTFTD
jgi:beta-glucosidase